MSRKPFPIAMLLLAASFLGGCSSWAHSFAGHDGPAVWMAMTAIAESPAYDSMEPTTRWLVDENRVWIDETESRIEIFRRVHRLEGPIITNQHRIEHTWRFQIRFHDGVEPSATFEVRGASILVQGQVEAEMYFAEVENLLKGDESLGGGGAPATMPDTEATPAAQTAAEPTIQPASQPAIKPTTQPDSPEVDLDDLDPDGK